MRIFTNIIIVLIAIVLQGQYSTLTVTSDKTSVFVEVEQISDNVTILNTWMGAEGTIWPEGNIEIAPEKFDKYNGHTFYCPWGCLLKTGENVGKFPATHVKITTSDGSDSDWLPLEGGTK